MKTRQWQAHVTGPEDRIVTFGVQAASLPAAILKVHRRASGLAWIPDHVTVTRLYGRHHPLRALSRAREIPPG